MVLVMNHIHSKGQNVMNNVEIKKYINGSSLKTMAVCIYRSSSEAETHVHTA